MRNSKILWLVIGGAIVYFFKDQIMGLVSKVTSMITPSTVATTAVGATPLAQTTVKV